MTKLTILAIILALGLMFATPANANDVDVYDVSLQNKQGSEGTTTVDIKFSVSQENTFSGTDANTATFYDRVWIFVKYFKTGATPWATNTAWKHATLTTGGKVTTYASGIGISADGKGAFVSPGANQTVRWNIGAAADEGSGVATTDSYKVRVYAIEMVLIPTGNFYLGDGTARTGATNSHFFNANSAAGAVVQVTSTAPYISDKTDGSGTAGDISWVNESTIAGAHPASRTQLNSSYPTGYNAFYLMKYEISQGQYCDFLNTLTQAQQQSRVVDTLTAEDAAGHYVMLGENITSVTNRQAIKAGSNPANGNPYTFGCDADADGTLNESNDSQWRACNYLCWADICAYADWAGLRPMTELEFEKACRGGNATSNVVASEYAWGNATIYSTGAYTLSNDGTAQETVSSQPTGTGNCNYNTTDGTKDGPLRCGIFATSATSRQEAGASYYGVMELSGNLWERPVSVMDSQSGTTISEFTGAHGDGALSTDGYATGTETSTWPGYVTDKITGADGSDFRGGSLSSDNILACVSDRYNAAYSDTDRYFNYGGRCSRTSP